MTPEVKILTVVKEILEALDWAAVGYPTMLIRHRRNRPTEESERPCVAIRYLTDQVPESQVEGTYLTADEMLIRMSLSFEIDITLPAEVTAEDAEAGVPDLDPTGMLGTTTIAGEIKAALKAEDSPLRLWADFATYEGQSADEDLNTADEAQLDVGMAVLYRVSNSDPRRLYAQGEPA